jgi:hypothetical protein
MTGPEHLIRWSTVAAVAAVAVVAGWVSYEHAYAVVSAYGEGGSVARLYPVTVDGLIYAASMVLLDSARRKVDPPVMAYWLLGVGIAATVAANVLDGLGHGPLAAGIAAWPALALVGSYELLMLLVRGTVRRVKRAGPDPDEFRTEDETRTEDSADDDPDTHTDDRPPPDPDVDRDALVAELAADIVASTSAGERWRPDYQDLEDRTGFRRSWCEKAVRDARAAAARTDAGVRA